MRIIVTGTPEGQLACSLLERARAQEGVEVIPVGRPELDLTDLDRIAPVLCSKQPSLIINAAAYTAVDRAESEAELCLRINGKAAGRVAQAAAQAGVPVIQISTDYVFDGTAQRPYQETDRVAPLDVYGETKLEGEKAVASATPDHVIIRTAWVYSPFGQNFLKTMLRLGESRTEVSVVSDQHGCPTSALDLADALLHISQRLVQEPESRQLRGLFHATGSGEATWAEFATEIFQAAEHHGRRLVQVRSITTAEYPTPARRPANSRLDGTKLKRVYGLELPLWRTSTRSCVARLLSVHG